MSEEKVSEEKKRRDRRGGVVRTSIRIDRKVWEKFKSNVSKSQTISQKIEQLIVEKTRKRKKR